MCGSRKYPYPHHRGSLENFFCWGGGGVSKAKFLKESTCISLNWSFQRGGGFKPKRPSMGGVWLFSGTTQYQEDGKGQVNLYTELQSVNKLAITVEILNGFRSLFRNDFH